MPNIATVLKAEITRLARKEVREEGDALKKVASSQRAEIASLKRRVRDLESVVKRLARGHAGEAVRARRSVAQAPDDAAEGGLRFRAQGMASNRKRLGLSAADFGLLVGATGQSVYSWEAGKAKPRADALAAIAALRGIGKREVAARLATLKVKS